MFVASMVLVLAVFHSWKFLNALAAVKLACWLSMLQALHAPVLAELHLSLAWKELALVSELRRLSLLKVVLVLAPAQRPSQVL